MATSGDSYSATSGDFLMATDTGVADTSFGRGKTVSSQGEAANLHVSGAVGSGAPPPR